MAVRVGGPQPLRVDGDDRGCGADGIGLAAQPGGARSLACARANSARCGQAEAMAILMRRTETVTRAPSLSSFKRMVPQVACANSVCGRPIRRNASSRT